MPCHGLGANGDLRQPVQRPCRLLIPALEGILALIQQRPMVNPGGMPAKLQGAVGVDFPLLAPAQQKGIAVPFAGFDAGEPVPVRFPQGQQHMRMEMPGIAFTGKGIVQGEVGDHPPRHELLHHKAPDERQPLLGRQLVRQGDVDFTGKLRIPALFHLLDVVPEGFAVAQPRRGSLREKDFLMHHPALGTVVKGLILPPVLQTLGGPIGGYGHHGTASAVMLTRNDLRFEVVDGQRGDGFSFLLLLLGRPCRGRTYVAKRCISAPL